MSACFLEASTTIFEPDNFQNFRSSLDVGNSVNRTKPFEGNPILTLSSSGVVEESFKVMIWRIPSESWKAYFSSKQKAFEQTTIKKIKRIKFLIFLCPPML